MPRMSLKPRTARAADAAAAPDGGRGDMPGSARSAGARVLLVYPRHRYDEALVRFLRGLRLEVVPVPLSAAVTWPPGAYHAAIVQSDSLDPSVRTVGQRLRRERPRLPLLYWASGPAETLVEALDAGFDAWLPAEVPPAGVAAQVLALCRLVEAAARPEEPRTLTVRNVTIDFQRFEVRSVRGTLTLTPTEFKIIAHLARRPGQVVRHAELFREVHGYEVSDQEAKDILKVHIWRLRNKLAAAGADGDCITNVRGFGYLLDRRASPAPEADLDEHETARAG